MQKCKFICNILLILFILPILFGCKEENHDNKIDLDSEIIPVDDYSNINLSEDILFVIDTLENTHPVFYLDEVPDDYYKQKKYINENMDKLINDDMTFEYELQKLIATLNDNHTRLTKHSTNYIVMNLKYNNDNLITSYNQTDYLLKNINGVTIDRLMKIIDECYPAENDSAKYLNYEFEIANTLILEKAGIDTDNIQIEMENSITGISESVNPDALFINYPSEQKSLTSEIVDDIIYIDMNFCQMDKDFYIAIDDIKEKIDQGYSDVIIDLRGNTGGNSTSCDWLLKTLEMTPPTHGAYTPNSEMARKVLGNNNPPPNNEDHFIISQDLKSASTNDDINLIVLTDKKTLSAANMLGTWVQDGELGIIIGETSAQSPTFFGDTTTVELPNKNFSLQIALRKIYRPDSDANQVELVPDIILSGDMDALASAIDYFDDM